MSDEKRREELKAKINAQLDNLSTEDLEKIAGGIDEQDIEKENLRQAKLDDVAGGSGSDKEYRPWNNAPDMENRIVARTAPELEGCIPAAPPRKRKLSDQ